MSDLLATAAAAGFRTLADTNVTIDPVAAALLDGRRDAVGLSTAGDILSVALSSIPTPAQMSEIEQLSGMALAVVVTTPANLEALQAAAAAAKPRHPNVVLGALLSAAHAASATDLLLIAGHRPAVRTADGTAVLADMAPLTPADVRAATAWFTGPGNGPVIVNAIGTRWRASKLTSAGRPALTIHQLPSAAPTAETLSLPSALLHAASAPAGMVVVGSGPRGGRSTTLAALVGHVSTHERVQIVCVGAPVEYAPRSAAAVVNTVTVGVDAAGTAEAIALARRLGADVLAVEVDDAQSVRAALQAASAGMRVLASAPGRTAVATLANLVSVLPPDEQGWAAGVLSRELRAATGQQLVAGSADGRTAVFEVLPSSETVRAALSSWRLDLLQAALSDQHTEGTCPMDKALALHVSAGRVERVAARAAAEDPLSFDRFLDHAPGAAVAATRAPEEPSAQPSRRRRR